MTNYPNDPNQPGGYGEQPSDGWGDSAGYPQYGTPEYNSPQYGAPQEDGAPQYGAPQGGSNPQYGAQPYGYPQYGAPQQGGSPYGAPVPQEHKMATLIMILGIASIPTVFCYVGVVLGIVSVVLGRQAQQEIDSSGGTIGGRGKVQAGFICGIIGTVLSILMIIAVVVRATS